MGEKIDQTFKFNLAPAQLARLEAILSAEFSQTADLIKVCLLRLLFTVTHNNL